VRELNRDSHPNEFDAYNINTSKKDTAKQSKRLLPNENKSNLVSLRGEYELRWRGMLECI
jgi:hypothetical protein